jgi:cation diffusion facilitator family transporter
MASGSKKVIIISLFANLGIAISKLIGAVFTGSASLLAEAVHSFSDCGNQLLLLYGQHMAAKPPTATHPLGRGREGFFWSFIVALMLFSLGGLFSFFEGLHKMEESGPLHEPVVGVLILLLAVGLEGYSFLACLKEVKAQNRHPSLWQWVRNTTSADLLVIFLEDLAALLGLAIALAALTASWITGDPLWDAFGSVLIGLLLIAVAFILAREIKSLLIGEAANSNYEEKIAGHIQSVLPTAALLRLIAVQTGIDSVLLAYKIKPGPEASDVKEMVGKINEIEAKVRQDFPEVQWQFAEIDYEK